MGTPLLHLNAGLQIARPPHDVFEAIADPQQMSNYFISHSSGRMEEGKALVWRFPEFDMAVPVRVGKIEKDKYLSYYWNANGKELLVEITLTPVTHHSTVVAITEGAMENGEAGIQWLKGNTEGWANFLACLKAYLEHGINLRKGSFDYRKGKVV